MARKSRDFAETYSEYVAQGIPQIDTAMAGKDRFR
jgi:hypothetical protein